MPRVSDNDHIPQHLRGVRQEATHACPQCPSPLAGGSGLMIPRPSCPWCRGTGQVSTEQLSRWQRTVLAGSR